MYPLNKTVVTVALAAALLVPISACSSKSKTTTTAAESNKTFEVITTDGQISVSLHGNLPPGWPSGFSLPGGAVPAGSGSLTNSSAGKQVAVFTTSASPSDTFAFYETDPGLTVDRSQSASVGPAYIGSVAVTGTYTGRVTVLSKGGSTSIVILLDATTGGSSSGGSTNTTGTSSGY